MSKASSRSGPSLISICTILALCFCVDVRHESLASDPAPFLIDGVAVYLQRDPPCTISTVSSLTVTVSPFKPQVDLGVLVAELARKAAEAHANAVYAIKLVSFIPNEGAVATATISTCPQTDQPMHNVQPFDPKLVDILKRAPDVRAYLFTNRFPDPQLSVQTSAPLQKNFVSADVIVRLRQLIFANDTYRSTSGVKLDKTCPFVASFGFEFRDENSSVWWLVSEMCETAALVSREDKWLKADSRNLKGESIAAFRQILESPK